MITSNNSNNVTYIMMLRLNIINLIVKQAPLGPQYHDKLYLLSLNIIENQQNLK